MPITNEEFEILPEQEKYIQIYHHYFVLHWNWSEIAKFFKVDKKYIQKAMKWVMENRLECPVAELVIGAIDAIRTRLKINQELYEKEAKRASKKNIINVLALVREIRADEDMLFKLQSLLPKEEDKDKSNLSEAAILKLISKAKEEGKKEATVPQLEPIPEENQKLIV